MAPSCDPRQNVNLTGGAPICFGETLIDGQIPDEFIADFLARKIRRILGESAKTAHTNPFGASVAKTEMGAGPFAGHSSSGPRPVRARRNGVPKLSSSYRSLRTKFRNVCCDVGPERIPVSSGLWCRRQLRAEVVSGRPRPTWLGPADPVQATDRQGLAFASQKLSRPSIETSVLTHF